MRDSDLVPPPYLPEIAQAVLPWTRRYVTRLRTRDGFSLEDLWDEAMAALLRACVYYDATPGHATKGNGRRAFSTYACNSVIRGCWRYVARADGRQRRLGRPVGLEFLIERAAASAEEEASARECARDFSTSSAPRPSSRCVPDALRR